MHASLQFNGVRIPSYYGFPRNSHFSCIRSLFLVASRCRSFHEIIENGCRNKALRLKSKGNSIKSLLRENDETAKEKYVPNSKDFTSVMKFGGSSVATAERMKAIAQLILSFPEENPVIVLSAVGKTTNNLLLVMKLSFNCFNFVNLYGHKFNKLMGLRIGWGKGSNLRCFKCI